MKGTIRFLVVLSLVSTGCLSLPRVVWDKEGEPPIHQEVTMGELTPDPDEGPKQSPVAPVTADQVTESNAHEMLQQLNAELDKDEATKGLVEGKKAQ